MGEWKKSAADVVKLEKFKKVILWQDSTNIPKQQHESYTIKRFDWSYKLNWPGYRYMILQDGNGIICKLWSGYLSKLFDEDFLELERTWYEERLEGVGIIVDQYFDWGEKNLKNDQFFTLFKKLSIRKRKHRKNAAKLI